MFMIEDVIHAELPTGKFATLAEAIEELERRAAVPWDKPPNVAPCTGWRECGRSYEIFELETSEPWSREVRRIAALEISATEVKWLIDITKS